MKEINTTHAPAALGPYSQAIRTGDYVFCSGQLGIDNDTGEMAEGVEAQTHEVMKNIIAILEAEGLSLNNVVKTTIFLADMADFETVNEIYASYLEEPYPARSTFAVKSLPKNGLVEIESIAEA